MSTFRAAKTIYHLAERRLSNLSLQKLLYLSHMMSLGMHDKGIVSNSFEAWDYGPVEPELYHKLKAYGSSPVPDIFPAKPYNEADEEFVAIKTVTDQLGAANAGRLVAITHWEEGAWAKCYRPGLRGIVIPDKLILEEYNARAERSQRKSSVSA